jgi:DNA adenine methylase
MKYMGSKLKIKNDIIPVIESYSDRNDNYIEPFCGGLSIIQEVKGFKRKIAQDINPYLIAMWIGLKFNFDRPYDIPKSLYDEYRDKYNHHKKHTPYEKIQHIVNTKFHINDKDITEFFLIGWIGYMGSFNGRFYDGGYSGKTEKRNYITEQIRNTEKQIPFLNDIEFRCGTYNSTEIKNAVVYCDPPYKNTKQYGISLNFDYESYYNWIEETSKNNIVICSEYDMPEDRFECIWSKEVTNSLNTTITYKPTERLYVVRK